MGKKLGYQVMAFRCPNALHERARIMGGALRLSNQQILEQALEVWVRAKAAEAKDAIDAAGFGDAKFPAKRVGRG